ALGFSAPTGILVQGNYIGTNAAGTAAIPNLGGGIIVGGFFQLNGTPITATDNTIGGSTIAARNVISGNLRVPGDTNLDSGVGVGIRRLNDSNPGQFITGGDSVDIVFNVIGTDPTQTLRLGNTLDGVYVDADSVDIYVNSNVIAFNGRAGVRIPDANGILNDNDNSGRLVNLDLNYIFGNSSLGVDLGFEGITPNDPKDVDGGANLQQNFPNLN